MSEKEYSFVVDTNKYAGNFKRHLCGYMTGDGGEYDHADVDAVFVKEVGDDHPLGDLMVYRVTDDDDVPIHAPVRIYPNPRWFSNGKGSHFRVDDPAAVNKALAAWKKSEIGLNEDMLRRAKLSGVQEIIDYYQRQIDEAKARTEAPWNFPAYTSVAIFLDQQPTQEQIDFLKTRAHRFVEFCRSDCEAARRLPRDLEIEGFRLVASEVVEHSVDL